MRHLIYFAILTASLGYAQIELPEFMLPEFPDPALPEAGQGEEGEPSPPDQEKGGEAAEQGGDENAGGNQELGDMSGRMRMMMNRNQEIVLKQRAGQPPEQRVSQKELSDRFLGGGQEVKVTLQTRAEELRGELTNQTLWVVSPLGRVVLRLSDMREASVQGESWDIRLKGGDALKGTPELETLELRLADGSRRQIPVTSIQSVKVR